MRLYDERGQRKYLTPSERKAFLASAENADDERVFTFCGTLGHSGCRISEALALTTMRVDLSDGVLVFESLKKREKGIFRAVPVPPSFLDKLASVHDLVAAHRHGLEKPLWSWSRTTAWRRVRAVMRDAGIAGLCASPKGLRHGFGIKATTSQVPLNLTQKWLGHSDISTTAIYADAIGPEEKQIAERMWDLT